MTNSDKAAPPDIHLGNLIEETIAREKLTKSTIADALGVKRSAFGSKLNAPNFGTPVDIALVSLACRTNFFAPYLTWLQANGVPSEVPELQQRLADAEIKAADLQQALAQCRLLNDFLIAENNALKIEKRDPSV
jgi:hypothetical protein